MEDVYMNLKVLLYVKIQLGMSIVLAALPGHTRLKFRYQEFEGYRHGHQN